MKSCVFHRGLMAATSVVALSLLLHSKAHAQSVWGGTGSTTSTTDYGTGTNWSSGAPPISAGQSAEFGATGSATINVGASPITPDSWTFDANSQSYTISGAAVNFSSTGTSLTNSANAGQTITINNNISTSGGLLQNGASTLVLTGSNRFAGGIEVDAGTLALKGAGAFVNGFMYVEGTGTLDISGTTSGAALAILGSSTAATINIGSKTLTLTNNTGFALSASIQGSGNVIFGDATLPNGTQVAYGGVATYTGTTTVVPRYTLFLDAVNALASSSGVYLQDTASIWAFAGLTIQNLSGDADTKVIAGGTLTITQGNSTFHGTIADDISSSATSLVKEGTGVFTLTNTSTYTGTTTVNGGSLVVDGSIASSPLTTVNAGGTLAGSGIVGSTVINGGVLAPGSAANAFGPLTVSGSLSFTTASTYLVQVNSASAGRTNISGVATLGGATVSANYLTQTLQAQYTLLHADGGISGAFNSSVVSNNANVVSTLSYDANNVYLNAKLNFTAPGGSLNANQQGVGNAIVNYFTTNGSIPLVFSSLSPSGLSQLSGETATGSQQTTFDAMTQFMGIMGDPFTAGRDSATPNAMGYTEADDALAYAPGGRKRSRAERDAYALFTKAPPKAFDGRWNVWVAGFGGSRTSEGNGALGSNGTTASIYGTAVGADYWFSPATVAGFSMAGGGTNFSVANGGTGHSDLIQAGAFVRHGIGAAYVTAAAAYGWQNITTDRLVTAGVTDRLHAEFSANAYSGRVEGGNRWLIPVLGGIGLTPYGAVQVTALDLPAYAETSTGLTFGLNYAGRTVTDTRTELGLRGDKSFALNDAVLTLRGRAAWAHDFATDRSVVATFQSLPGASFAVSGAAQSPNSALTSASAELKWSNGWAMAATFDGEFSDTIRSYSGKGVVRYAW